ncbi:general substrate transporter [Boeremia exigua]|uniref:general substrate transporter n=1 Tax=Boeremia exigua TaxID=749465 RepID=UPI001E8D4CD2|nr:general substrate transporter [Boeremia exigua]KAH6611692.1 general substrate transporter [Boeremia exigua]
MVLAHLKAVGAELAAVLPENDLPWYKKPNLRRLIYSSTSMFLLASANGYDGSMMNGLQALPQWENFMDTPTGAWLGFINAVQSLGAFSAYPVAAYCANKFGRKRTMYVAYFWLALGVALQTAAQNTTMFIFGRLFIGGVTCFFSSAAPLLITETAYPTHRGGLTALYGTGWYIGSTIAAWATYATRNYAGSEANWAWRIPSILQLLIPLVALPGLLIAPESPRWLSAVGRTDEARAILQKFHAEGDEHSRLVDFEMAEISETLRLERERETATTWLDLVRTKGNRHRFFISITLGVFAQWNGVGIVSYYLAPVLRTVGITSVTQQTLISGFLQIWNLIIAVTAALTVDLAGRRRLFLISSSGMLVCYIIISGLAGSFANTAATSTGIAVIPFLFVYYGFYDIAFTPLLYGYTCEIWPYELRARGVASMNLATSMATFFNIFVNPIALDGIQWRYYLVYVALLFVITTTIYFFYPETRGHSLEEMARIFDGEKAAVPSEGSILGDNKDSITVVEGA